MSVTVELPSALQPYAGGSRVLTVSRPCATVGQVLTAVADEHPGVLDRVMDERGEVRQHVNVFVGAESIRFLGGLEAEVPEGTIITIVPAVSGG